jgi:hypothetical protein
MNENSPSCSRFGVNHYCQDCKSEDYKDVEMPIGEELIR